jgi:hypothetical protein
VERTANPVKFCGRWRRRRWRSSIAGNCGAAAIWTSLWGQWRGKLIDSSAEIVRFVYGFVDLSDFAFLTHPREKWATDSG